MKLVLLFFTMLLFNSRLFSQYSDLKEYGLKGNIKSIQNAVYTDAKLMGKKSKIDLTNAADYYKNMHFNPSGQIDTLWIVDQDEADSLFNNTYIMEFENGKKSGYKMFGYQNVPYEYAQINWMDERTYSMTITDTKGELLSESTTWLSAQFQDSTGKTLLYQSGEWIGTWSYMNRFGKGNRVVGVDFITGVNEIRNSEVIEYLEFDKKGNWTKSVVRNTFTGQYLQMTSRTIEYY